MKSSIENLLSPQLQGLLPPPQHAVSPWLIVAGFLLLTGVSIVLLKIRNTRQLPASQAARQIRALLPGPASSENLSRKSLLQLASLLRQGLEVSRLDSYEPADPDAWQAFLQKLNTACYADNPPPAQTIGLIEESLHWLARHAQHV